MLHSLELTRERLGEYFPQTVADVTVVLHRSAASLATACPPVPAVWFATAPAARRYLAGWAGRNELHVLEPALLARRASAVPGSREMLELTPAALYARLVVGESNRDLRERSPLGRARAALRWAWLLEGTARWFAGQTEHARPAVARRLRDGSRPRFPPGIRDSLLLGGTVIDLLVREEGERAAVELASRLDPRGARASLVEAFGGRALRHTEEAWRAHLRRVASPSYASA